jgi:hypothetical protein
MEASLHLVRVLVSAHKTGFHSNAVYVDKGERGPWGLLSFVYNTVNGICRFVWAGMCSACHIRNQVFIVDKQLRVQKRKKDNIQTESRSSI